MSNVTKKAVQIEKKDSSELVERKVAYLTKKVRHQGVTCFWERSFCIVIGDVDEKHFQVKDNYVLGARWLMERSFELLWSIIALTYAKKETDRENVRRKLAEGARGAFISTSVQDPRPGRRQKKTGNPFKDSSVSLLLHAVN